MGNVIEVRQGQPSQIRRIRRPPIGQHIGHCLEVKELEFGFSSVRLLLLQCALNPVALRCQRWASKQAPQLATGLCRRLRTKPVAHAAQFVAKIHCRSDNPTSAAL
ncbi:hypothetical protein D3C78_1484250 [compost metagenome]